MNDNRTGKRQLEIVEMTGLDPVIAKAIADVELRMKRNPIRGKDGCLCLFAEAKGWNKPKGVKRNV